MVVRFVTNAVGSQMSIEEATQLVKQVAEEIWSTPIRLDHAIWRKESGRDINTDASAPQD